MNISLSLVRLVLASLVLWPSSALSQVDGPLPGDMGSRVLPGSAAGARGSAESPIEHINLYNGHLNVTIPVTSVGGRGGAGFGFSVPIERRWYVFPSQPSQSPAGPTAVSWFDADAQGDSSPEPYGAARMAVRRTSALVGACTSGGNHWDQGPYLSYLVLSMSDGTEILFRDVMYDGQPQGSSTSDCGAIVGGGQARTSRGTTFVSTDGSNLTFVGSSAIVDSAISIGLDGEGATGTLYFPDGTQWNFDANGDLQNAATVDRNGNTTILHWDSSSDILSATDTLGRSIQANVFNANSGSVSTVSGSLEPQYDLITYPGFNKQPRTVTVNRNTLDAALFPGETVQPFVSLFPELAGNNFGSCADKPYQKSWCFAPEVFTSVVLPDGSSKYSFLYNKYGELAQMTLPTGGIYQYIYQQTYTCPSGTGGSGGDGVVTIPVSPGENIYRRLTERDEYANGIGAGVTAKTTYHACAESAGVDPNRPPVSGTVVYVDRFDGAGHQLRHEAHYFYGDASATTSYPQPLSFPAWTDGLEFRTDIGDSSTAIRKRTDYRWTQRPCGTSPAGGVENCAAYSGGVELAGVPSHDPQVCQINTSLDGGPQAGSVFVHDNYNNVTDSYLFDYGAAPALGTTCPTSSSLSGFSKHLQTAFNYGTSYVNANTHIWNLPSSTKLLDGTGATMAQQTFSYDGSSVTNEPGIVGLNNPSGNARGNLTSVQEYWNTASANIGHTYTYDNAGNILSDLDAKNNKATFSYVDPDSTYAHVTGATFASNSSPSIAQTVSAVYDYSSGLLTSFTDVNGGQRIFSYNPSDPFDRLTSIARPDGGGTTFTYPTLLQTTATAKQTSSVSTSGTLIYDGLGRAICGIRSDSTSNSIASGQAYDALGRIQFAFDPQSVAVGAMSCPTAAAQTALAYDSLNRITSTTTPDGLSTTATYSANAATITDQASHQIQYTSDAFGRLTKVVENPAGTTVNDSTTPTVATTYCYNLLDELNAVYQPVAFTSSQSCASASGYSGQVRTFSYDSLGQVTAVSNPEYTTASGAQGSYQFTYDNNGNLASRSDPLGQKTCFSYDQLDRPTGIQYLASGGCSDSSPSLSSSNPGVSFAYGTSGFGTGRLTQITKGSVSTQFSNFDAMGRPQTSTQTVGTVPYSFQYIYDLAGNLSSETYPSNRKLLFQYDLANRPVQVQNNASSSNYAGSVQYNPASGLASLTLGNSVSRTITPNSRWQPNEITDKNGSGNTILDLGYTWDSSSFHNNGSLLRQVITTPTTTFTQNYGYDPLNRISSISDSAGSSSPLTRTFNYDAFGNSWVPSQSAGLPNNPLTPTIGSAYATNNRLGTASNFFSYDLNGNLTTLGSYALNYDYENRLGNVQQAQAGSVTYTYDGLGQRVHKLSGSGSATDYVYDAFGQLAAEYSTAPSTPPCATCYLSWDHLGSTRMLTDGQGNVVARHDFLAFGDEVASNSMGRTPLWNPSTDNTTQRFTGQEHDDTTLDYFDARYFYSGLGRFTSPDPLNAGADLGNPQSWNGYAYVQNSPLSAVDPDGLGQCPSPCTSTGGSDGTTTGTGQTDGGNGWGPPFSFGVTLGGGGGNIAANFSASPRSTGSGRPGLITQYGIGGPDLPRGDQIGGRILGFAKSVLLDGLNTIDDLTGNQPNALKTNLRFALLPSSQQQRNGAIGFGYVANVDAAVVMGPALLSRNSVLFRRGAYDTRRLLEEQALAAQKAENIGIHGVSVNTSSAAKPGQIIRCTTCGALQDAGFTLEKTGRDPGHYTVGLPQPVTSEIARLWNELFQIFK